MKRLFDLTLSLIAALAICIPALLIAMAIRTTSRGSILYWSDRVGRSGRIFRMPKFRTMRAGTPQLATDKLADPANYLTPIGAFLRKTSIDELPQLWSILTGNMSFVGPRPTLFNQHDLIAQRAAAGVDRLVPGLTGWAQVNGRDDISDERKLAFDVEYARRQSFWFDLRILWMTMWKVIGRDGVAH